MNNSTGSLIEYSTNPDNFKLSRKPGKKKKADIE